MVDQSFFSMLAFFDKFDSREIQELLSFTTSSWLLGGDDLPFTVDLPPGIIRQLNNFTQSTMLILTPVSPGVDFDCKTVHQILRELTVGIYCFNQTPFVSLEANHDQSSSCQLTPAYVNTRTGRLLLDMDYRLKALWHGALIPAEKRLGFCELWRSCLGAEGEDFPPRHKNPLSDFLSAGLMDISEEPSYHGIYDKGSGTDPTYDPNLPEERQLFSQYLDSILLKLTTSLSSVCQHESLFLFEVDYHLAAPLRLPEDQLDLCTYQRLRQRLQMHEELVKNCLGRKAEACRDLAYLKLITFLVPLLVALKKRMKIPDMSQMLPPFLDDKMKTEREFPPLMLGPGFSCKHFPYKEDEYFHLHGGIELDISSTPLEDMSQEIKESYTTLQSCASEYLTSLLSQDALYRKHIPFPVVEFAGKSYYLIPIQLESLYSQPNHTRWWEAMAAAVKAQRAKRLPMTDLQLHEQFKKLFGYQHAIRCKSVPYGLKMAAERGLCAAFHTLIYRSSLSHLGVPDEQGYSLAHHAAIRNQAHILCQLAAAGVSVNQTRGDRSYRAVKTDCGESFEQGAGSTPLHLAAQCGSLEALNCLLGLRVDYKQMGPRGWMAIHYAAYYGQVACIKALCRKDTTLVETPTAGEYHSYPLLLAASSGSVDALECLLSLGADWRKEDSRGNNVVHLSALYLHTHVLCHLIQKNIGGLPLWHILVDMLKGEDLKHAEMSVRCLEVLSVTMDSFWKEFVVADGIQALLHLLSTVNQVLQCVSAAVICQISTKPAVCKELERCEATPLLVSLLFRSTCPELHSRCAVILADMIAHSKHNQTVIAQLGGVPPLVRLLGYNLQDVLLNVVRCICAVTTNCPRNQSSVVQAGAVPPLVEFLSVTSEVLQEETCCTLAELARRHEQNQGEIYSAGVVRPLVAILRNKNIIAQLQAARAVEALAEGNSIIQASFLDNNAAKYLLSFLKAFQLDVREQGTVSLWALAGQTQKQRRLLADQIGYQFILEFLLSSSDRIQYVGCQAVVALTQDSRKHQDGLCREKVVPPLVRLIRRSGTTQHTLLTAIRALGLLCLGIAHSRNSNSQRVVAEENTIPVLMDLLKHHNSLQVEVQVLQTLACVVLGNQELQKVLRQHESFNYSTILELQQAHDQSIRLEAGYALTLFAYNSPAQQSAILQSGGVPASVYEPFLQSADETERAKTAFQVVVLAKVIRGGDPVTLSARGVTVLVDLLRSTCPSTVVLAAHLLASLSHTRAGIPDAIVTMGTVGQLCLHLCSDEEEVQAACACALGYLTFNRRAHRLLLVECRKYPKRFNLLMEKLGGDGKISQTFTAEFLRQKSVGLPSLSVQKNAASSAPLNREYLRLRSAPMLLCRTNTLSSHTAPSNPIYLDSHKGTNATKGSKAH